MPLVKIVNWEGGSNARYDVRQMTRNPDGTYSTDGFTFDSEGRPLSGGVPGDREGEWTPGLPGARGGFGPGDFKGGGGAAVPGAAIYAQAMAAAKQRYQQRLADLNTQRSNLFRKSGFQADVDANTGLISNMRVDPFNQYGTFQLLNRAQAIRSQQGQDENIARGLGTRGGLAAQRMNDLRFGFGQEDAEFGAGLADALGWLTRQQQDYKYEYDQALWQLQLEALRDAMMNQYYGYSGGVGGGGPHAAGSTGITKGSPAARYPGAAGFGGGLAAAQMAARQKKKTVVKRPPLTGTRGL